MNRIVFIGFIGKNFGNFLVDFNIVLRKQHISFAAIAFGMHEKAFEDITCDFDLYDLGRLPDLDEPFGSAEFWVSLFPANLYLLWNGYHGAYAQIRNYFAHNNIPYLLSEYSSVEKLFYFDKGLHAEATIPTQESNRTFDISLLEPFIKPRHDVQQEDELLRADLLKSNKKKILFIGMWDDAAGLSYPNSETIQRALSPWFQSSYDAVAAIANELPQDIQLIIKSHPYDNVEQKEKMRQLGHGENIIYIDQTIDLVRLIELSDLVITIASTVSVLTAYLNKPLLLLGNTYLSHSNYAYHYDGISLDETISKILTESHLDQAEERSKFFRQYLFDFETFSSDKTLIAFGVKSHEKLVEKCQLIFGELPTVVIEMKLSIVSKINAFHKLKADLAWHKEHMDKYWEEAQQLKADLAWHKEHMDKYWEEAQQLKADLAWQSKHPFKALLKNLSEGK